MGLFNSEEERQRKENLKSFEDKRLRFAQALAARDFRPERMLLLSREDGSFVALARHGGKFALIESPKFGQEGEFTLDLQDEAPHCVREEISEKGTGLNGAFGMGTKGAKGFYLYVPTSDGARVKAPVIYGRNSWQEVSYRKNTLLRTARRRGNANVVWDLMPIDAAAVRKIEFLLDDYYLK